MPTTHKLATRAGFRRLRCASGREWCEATALHGLGGQRLRDRTLGGEQGDVQAVKGLRPRLLHGEFLSPNLDGLARGTSRGQQPQLRERKRARQQQTDQLLTDRARRTDDTDSVGG